MLGAFSKNIFTKIKISRDPWIRLTSKQFSRVDQVKSCPAMWVPCLFMRCSKILLTDRSGHDAPNERNFRKSATSEEQIEFWRPCRGLSPGKGEVPNKATQDMTRTAFLAVRVIQRQGKLSFNMLVKKWEKLISKIKISQNLWVRFTPDQFFRIR